MAEEPQKQDDSSEKPPEKYEVDLGLEPVEAKPEDPEVQREREARLKDIALERGRLRSDLVWRPHVYEGMFQHLALAEGDLWPIGFGPTTIRSIPGLAEIFDKCVPDEFVSVDLNDDGFSEVRISCPCGEEHHVEVGTIAVAPCARVFYWFGQEVRRATLADVRAADSSD